MLEKHSLRVVAMTTALAFTILAGCGGGGGGGSNASGGSVTPSGSTSSAATSSTASSVAAAASSSVASSSVASSSALSSVATSSASSAAVSSAAATSVASAALFNVDGYAHAASVTGGGVVSETASTYAEVTNPLEFVTALSKVKTGAVKVIEIANDLDLGYNEVTTAYPTATTVYSAFRSNNAVKLHPKLMTTGVSLIDIQSFNGLTIYSKNGSTIRHAELNIKNGSNMIIRNLKFDEMWEWDESTKGNYDSNDWDYITIGDASSATGGIWIDHCTFYKTYDGIVDIKKGASIVGTTGAATQAANGITISWSEILPGDGSGGAFVKQQFDALEAATTGNTMYKYLRGFLSEDQIIQVASTVKKGHLIGASDLSETSGYTVTLHHNYYKDLQDRMPRLRSGDVQVFNLYADESNARIIKKWYDALVAANPTLTAKLTDSGPTYHFGITSNGSISTESGNVEVTNSFYKGVLTPLRNNQTDPTNSAYTGAIVAYNTRHELLSGDDAAYMPSPQGTYTDSYGTWMYWQGNSSDSGSSLGPTQATPISFAWHNGAPPTPLNLTATSDVPSVVSSNAGAGKISLTAAQWMNSNN